MKLIIFLTAILILSCSNKPTLEEVAAPSAPQKKSEGISIETQQLASEQKADFSTEISFEKKKAQLGKNDQEKIRKLLAESARKGPLDRVQVLTWSDSEYPSVYTKKLSEEERQLVNDRNQAIEKFIREQNSEVQIKTYSMAERPNIIKEFVGSSEARLKKSLERAGIPNTDTSVKFPAKASRAILLIDLKE